MADTPKLNPVDESHAKLITTLLCSAKCLQNIAHAARTGAPDEALGKRLDGLINSVVHLWRGDGERLEKETLELAARLGFRVEQMETGKGGVN